MLSKKHWNILVTVPGGEIVKHNIHTAIGTRQKTCQAITFLHWKNPIYIENEIYALFDNKTIALDKLISKKDGLNKADLFKKKSKKEWWRLFTYAVTGVKGKNGNRLETCENNNLLKHNKQKHNNTKNIQKQKSKQHKKTHKKT